MRRLAIAFDLGPGLGRLEAILEKSGLTEYGIPEGICPHQAT
jgi:hypothetical protein